MNAWILARKLALMSGGKNRSSIPCTHAAILPPHPSIQARRPEVRVCTFCCAAVVVDCTLSCTPLVAPVTWSAMLAFGPSGVGLRGWEALAYVVCAIGMLAWAVLEFARGVGGYRHEAEESFADINNSLKQERARKVKSVSYRGHRMRWMERTVVGLRLARTKVGSSQSSFAFERRT